MLHTSIEVNLYSNLYTNIGSVGGFVSKPKTCYLLSTNIISEQ